MRLARSSNKPKSWTFFPSLTSWAAQWHSWLLVRHHQPWDLRGGGAHLLPRHPQNQDWFAPREDLFLRDTPQVWVLNGGCCHQFSFFSPLAPAWCLRSEGVSSVLLGVSSAEQLMEHLGALQVSWGLRGGAHLCPLPRKSCPHCPPRNGLGRSVTTKASPSAEDRSGATRQGSFPATRPRGAAPQASLAPPHTPLALLWGASTRPHPTAFPSRC